MQRFTSLRKEDEDEAENWRGKLTAFRNLYSFLSQIIPYQDSDLEKLYTYLRHLSPKLPKRGTSPAYVFDDEVRLEYYRLQKISEGSISLNTGKAKPLDGPAEVGTGVVREEPMKLSKLIDLLNERFGTDFTEADQLFFDQIMEAAMTDESLHQAAKVNSEEKFKIVFNTALENLFVERLDQNEEIVARVMNEDAFRKQIAQWMAEEVYRKIRPQVPVQYERPKRPKAGK